MSQAQTRKQKILGDVKKKRQQRAIISVLLAIALIAIVVVAVIALSPKQNLVVLPNYLSRCVNGAELYHSHPNLTVTINGVGMPLPNDSFNGSCAQPLHTHAGEVGIIHIETDENRDYTLSDWFLLWGYSMNSPTFTIFNNTQIFNYKTDATHHLTMTVNGTAVPMGTIFASHLFPRNASPTGGVGGSGLCAAPTGQPCVKDNIAITYG